MCYLGQSHIQLLFRHFQSVLEFAGQAFDAIEVLVSADHVLALQQQLDRAREVVLGQKLRQPLVCLLLKKKIYKIRKEGSEGWLFSLPFLFCFLLTKVLMMLRSSRSFCVCCRRRYAAKIPRLEAVNSLRARVKPSRPCLEEKVSK